MTASFIDLDDVELEDVELTSSSCGDREVGVEVKAELPMTSAPARGQTSADSVEPTSVKRATASAEGTATGAVQGKSD